MSEHEYAYRGLLAETWDLLRGNISCWPDAPFYRQIMPEYSQPGLDVGCSTGRLILDYLAGGFDVDGVDVSPDMLAICRRKAQTLGLQPNLYEQRWRHWTCRAAMMPSSSPPAPSSCSRT